MLIIAYRKVFYALTAALVLASLGAVLFFGLNLGIEFSGGAMLEYSYEGARPAQDALQSELAAIGLAQVSLRPVGDSGYLLRTGELSEEERQAAVSVFESAGNGSLVRYSLVGPVVGEELRNKALVAIALVMVAIVLFIAFAFRKVSAPVSSWKYGMVAIVALVHDIIIPVGLFALLGYAFGAQVDVLFVMALLAVLGYSINDTIVVFDRVRENLKTNEELGKHEDFSLTVGKSVSQTVARSINTSLTTAIALLALFFIGADATQDFALVLLAGVVAGAYSSIFLAAPLLVTLERLSASRR